VLVHGKLSKYPVWSGSYFQNRWIGSSQANQELPRKIQHILLKTGETMKITISNKEKKN